MAGQASRSIHESTDLVASLEAALRLDETSSISNRPVILADEPVRGWNTFMTAFSGRSFEGGIYRIFDAEESARAADIVGRYFPESPIAATIGHDSLGSITCLGTADRVGDEPGVLIMDFDTGETAVTHQTFRQFFAVEVPTDEHNPIAASWFRRWGKANPDKVPLKRDEIVGFRVPLFFGGEDRDENKVVQDRWVYWEMLGQIQAQLVDVASEGLSNFGLQFDDDATEMHANRLSVDHGGEDNGS